MAPSWSLQQHQEGSQGRGRVDPAKQSVHAAVAQLVHIVNRVGAGDQ